MNFWYYALLLLSLSFGDTANTKIRPLAHTGSVQIYYFYDSRLASDVGEQMMYLTENLLAKQYQEQVSNGDIILYKVDLASPNGQTIARRCNIVLTGLVVTRRNHIKDLTQNGYQYARSNPQAFQENLAYTINTLLPATKRPK